MLVLDSTIGCIEASESEVLELYRSAPVVKPSSPRARAETWEAHVCAIKKKARVTVYLSLVVDDKRIYVYSGTVKADCDEEFRATVQLALECARKLGLSPSPVDLSYSPAMREVVVRNSKILRLPGAKAKTSLKHGTPGAPPLPIASAAKESPQQPVDAAPISPPSPSAPTAPAMPAVMPTAGLPAHAEDPTVIELQQALAKLQRELDSVQAERECRDQELRELSVRHREISAELSAVREECAGLSAQRDQLAQQQQDSRRLLDERDAVAIELREVAELHQQVAAELARAREECDALREKCGALREECDALRKEREGLLRQAEGAEKASAALRSLQKEVAELSRQHEEASRRLGESDAGSAAHAEALARARREVTQLTAERDAALKSAETGDAVQAEALAQTRREVAQLTTERNAALKSAEASDTASRAVGAELDGLRRELAAARAEREDALARVESLKEQMPAAEAKALRQEPKRAGTEHRKMTELGSSSRVMDTAGPVATVPLPGMDQELLLADDDTAAPLDVPDFADFTAVQDAAPPFQALEFPTFGESAAEFSPVQETAPSAPLPEPAPELQSPFDQAPESTAFAGFQGDFFGATADDEQVRFMLEPQLTAVECNCAEDVLELQQSINQVNLTPAGTGQESCRGYICCLRKGDSREVFTAIHGAQSGRTWVYLPEVQPRDDAEYSRIVRGAVSFAEEVGLMMEPVRLDPAPQQRHERLKRCPALRITGQK